MANRLLLFVLALLTCLSVSSGFTAPRRTFRHPVATTSFETRSSLKSPLFASPESSIEKQRKESWRLRLRTGIKKRVRTLAIGKRISRFFALLALFFSLRHAPLDAYANEHRFVSTSPREAFVKTAKSVPAETKKAFITKKKVVAALIATASGALLGRYFVLRNEKNEDEEEPKEEINEEMLLEEAEEASKRAKEAEKLAAQKAHIAASLAAALEKEEEAKKTPVTPSAPSGNSTLSDSTTSSSDHPPAEGEKIPEPVDSSHPNKDSDNMSETTVPVGDPVTKKETKEEPSDTGEETADEKEQKTAILAKAKEEAQKAAVSAKAETEHTEFTAMMALAQAAEEKKKEEKIALEKVQSQVEAIKEAERKATVIHHKAPKRKNSEKARIQPKPPAEEARLSAQYAAMSPEERAFQILMDLDMVQIHPDPDAPNYDHTRDNELVSGMEE